MDKKSIIVIGAGIAGLCAGNYAQMNGYNTHIFEMHNKSGGFCTSWRRKEYIFDGCIHWLMGSGPGYEMYDWWLEVGALQGRTFIDHEFFTHFVSSDRRTVTFYTDANRLEEHLLELAPQDEETIKELTRDIRALSKNIPGMGKPQELMTKFETVKFMAGNMSYIRTLMKYNGMTVGQLAYKFNDPLLREAFLNFFGGVLEEAATGPVMTMAGYHLKICGYPIGGSRPFAQAVEQHYLDLGGKITYKAKVDKILVENNCAVGVRLTDGSEHRADIVVSAADGRATIFDLLGGAYINDDIKKLYSEFKVWDTAIQVSLGVARDLKDEPQSQTVYTKIPIELGNRSTEYLRIRHYCYDPTMAPEGKSVVTILFNADYDYWKNLITQGEDAYKAEKERLLKEVIARLEEIYPGISADIEASDVATPVTFERYTGAWKGSFMSWLDTPETNSYAYSKGIPRRLPGLKNFYMAGQWVSVPGGLPTGLMTGREVIQLICHDCKDRFVTTIP